MLFVFLLSLLLPFTSSLVPIDSSLIPFSGEKVLGGGSPRFANYNVSGSPYLAVAYESSSGSDKQIVSAVSMDGGNTWGAPVVVVGQPSAVSDLANPSLYQLPGGRLVCAFRHHTNQPGQPTIYRIEVCATDDMKTWQFLGTVEAYTSGAATSGIWEPFLFQIPGNPALFCAYAKELGASGEQNIVARMSTNGGQTWGSERILSHTTKSRDGMPSVAVLSDGSLLVACEGFWAGTWGKFTVNSRRSHDGGNTWGSPEVIHASPGSKNSGAPWVAALPNNKVVAVFMTDEDWTGAQNWPDHASVKAMVGTVQGDNIAWGDLQTVNGPASWWPSVYYWRNRSTLFVSYNNVQRNAQM